MKTELKGNWRLLALPNEEVKKTGFAPVHTAEFAVRNDTIGAEVPGCMELDLFRAGLAPDPFFAGNPLVYQQFENRHLWYYTEFNAPEGADELLFEGVDTIAEIYLNGALLGKAENMMIPHTFAVSGLKKTGNSLVVHILPAMIEARRYPLTPLTAGLHYNAASLPIRKAAYMYGWDIFPRFVSGGIFCPVYLVKKPPERIEEYYLYTTKADTAKHIARVNFFYRIHTDADSARDLTLSLRGTCGTSEFAFRLPLWHTDGTACLTIPDPLLWFPKNAGEPALYDVTLTFTRGETVLDEKRFSFGIRTVELVRTSVLDGEGNGDFYFRVNGKKVFCLGTNWVPTDAFPGRQPQRLARGLKLLSDVGCNAVRVWGGGLYEEDAFYDYCDRHGILVWQDFAFGCAIYPEDERFLKLCETEAQTVIRRLRQHPSLALWAGDNEGDLVYGWKRLPQDPNAHPLTRTVLARAVREYDPVCPYLPSSPYLDLVAFGTRVKTPEDHLWGPRDYFKGDYYKGAKTLFASEIGYHGCPSPASLANFISADQLFPPLDENGNGRPDWLVHAASPELSPAAPYAYRIPLMCNQVKTMFGDMAENLPDFARQSQISQAEAMKYFIEKFRLVRERAGGIIWWNLIDGWPQISDAVVDYYGTEKLAYSFIRRVQAPLLLSFAEPESEKYNLYAVSELPAETELTFTVTDLPSGKTLRSGTATAKGEGVTLLGSLPRTDDFHFYLIEWQAGEHSGKNHYITQARGISYGEYLRALTAAGLDAFSGFDQ